jgi:hypothetical protein
MVLNKNIVDKINEMIDWINAQWVKIKN